MLFSKKKETVGQLGEKIAKKYLKRKKYKIIETNFQNNVGRRVGEIDIIAKIKNKKNNWEFIFAEVKTRISKNEKLYSLPEENINRQKLYKLQKIAQVYIRKNNLWDYDYRFDAISIWLSQDCKNAKVRHLKSIFL